MAPEDQAGSGGSAFRRQPDTVGLAVAGILWLVIQGYCAIGIVRRLGPAEGAIQAAVVMAVPLVVLVGWWALLRRVSIRWTRPAGSAPGTLWFSNGLLVLATALGIASAWQGETYVRAAREAGRLATTRVVDPQMGDTAAQTAQAFEAYHTLAIAGGLLQLAVVALGVALCRQAQRRESIAR